MKTNWHTQYGPYPGEWPEKPYAPTEPKRHTYIGHGAIEKPAIYSDYEMLREIDDEGEFWECNGYEDGEIPKRAAIGLHQNLTLQDILDLVPAGVEPKDIVFDLSYPRHVDYIWISFRHLQRNMKTEESMYKRDMENYQTALIKFQADTVKYEKDLAAYQKWTNEQEVKELEKKLAKLKG